MTNLLNVTLQFIENLSIKYVTLILIGQSFDLVTINSFFLPIFDFEIKHDFDFIASLHDHRYIPGPIRANQHSVTFYHSVNTELTRMLG